MDLELILIFFGGLSCVLYWVFWPKLCAWQIEALTTIGYFCAFGLVGKHGHDFTLVLYAGTPDAHGKPILLCWVFMTIGAVSILVALSKVVELFLFERKRASSAANTGQAS